MQPDLMRQSRGVRFGGETLNFVAAHETIRPLRDNLLVEPMEVVYSRYIIVKHDTKPLRGRVLAAGPGHYPKLYDHREKHKRSKMWDSKVFVPTEVQVGDIVELGGSELEGYAFEQFWYGDKCVLWCTERDVCGVVPE
jgi:co-chaperonin GroES (HSP10)